MSGVRGIDAPVGKKDVTWLRCPVCGWLIWVLGSNWTMVGPNGCGHNAGVQVLHGDHTGKYVEQQVKRVQRECEDLLRLSKLGAE